MEELVRMRSLKHINISAMTFGSPPVSLALQAIERMLRQRDWGPSYIPASILPKSTSGRHRPVSYPDGPMTARYRFT